MISIHKSYTISCAHQIEGHPKCGRIHGHNYVITFGIRGEPDANTGMILDYGILDNIVKPLMDNMDHRYISSTSNINANNPFASIAIATGQAWSGIGLEFSTAECLARWLYDWFKQRLLNCAQMTYFDVYVVVKETDKTEARCDHSET